MANVRSFRSLIAEMKEVAAGRKRAPENAAEASYEPSPSGSGGGHQGRAKRRILGHTKVESIEMVARLLRPENRELLAMIAEEHPSSVTELAKRVGRAQSNVSRTLSKLSDLGLVELKGREGQPKAPNLVVDKLSCELDLLSGRVTLYHS